MSSALPVAACKGTDQSTHHHRQIEGTSDARHHTKDACHGQSRIDLTQPPLGGERDENEVVDLYKSTLGK